jgi:hypothetical protein
MIAAARRSRSTRCYSFEVERCSRARLVPAELTRSLGTDPAER